MSWEEEEDRDDGKVGVREGRQESENWGGEQKAEIWGSMEGDDVEGEEVGGRWIGLGKQLEEKSEVLEKLVERELLEAKGKCDSLKITCREM